MRVLGIPVVSPQAAIERTVADLDAAARLIRGAPEQLDRLLSIGEELVSLGHRMVDLAERLDRRAQRIERLGGRLDDRATSLLALGGEINQLGEQIDRRGAEIVDRAAGVVRTGERLIVALPTLERALELATPLEGAIDRVGRFVDRLPGGPNARRRGDPPPPDVD